MYLHLKITGNIPLHGKLPGEEFWIRVGDDGRSSNRLWGKRLEEERLHAPGAVAIMAQAEALPQGETALDDVPGAPAPAQTLPPRLGLGDPGLEDRLMTAVAKALAGIRAEISRSAPSGKVDLSAFDQKLQGAISQVRVEFARAHQLVLKAVADNQVRVALINDAWRVRMAMPPGWQPGDAFEITNPPPLIMAEAERKYHSDLGLAAMTLTEEDLNWQYTEAEAIRAAPIVSGKMSSAA
jgi:hypothetical protein